MKLVNSNIKERNQKQFNELEILKTDLNSKLNQEQEIKDKQNRIDEHENEMEQMLNDIKDLNLQIDLLTIKNKELKKDMTHYRDSIRIKEERIKEMKKNQDSDSNFKNKFGLLSLQIGEMEKKIAKSKNNDEKLKRKILELRTEVNSKEEDLELKNKTIE